MNHFRNNKTPQAKMRKKLATFLGRSRIESLVPLEKKANKWDIESLHSHFVANYPEYAPRAEQMVMDMLRQAR